MTACEHNLVNARVIECRRCECGIGRRQLALGYPDAHEFYGKHAGHAMRITCECGRVEEIGGETAPVRDPGHLLAEGVKPIDWTDDVVRRINDRTEQVLGRMRPGIVHFARRLKRRHRQQ